MTEPSSGRSGGAKTWALAGVGAAAAVGCVLAVVLGSAQIMDSTQSPAAANSPARPAACSTTVHGFVVGRAWPVATFIPPGFKVTPSQAGSVTYSLKTRKAQPPRVQISVTDFTGKLTGSVGGLSAPVKIRVHSHQALLETGASRGLPYIGVYWKQGRAHLVSVVGYKVAKRIVLRVANHVHANIGAKIPLPLNPGRIVSRATAVAKARSGVWFHPGGARAKLSSWTEALGLLPEQFRVQSGFDPTPWKPIWVVMVTHPRHRPQLVLIGAHSGGVAFSAGAGDRSHWFEALTDRDPALRRGCPGGTSARLPFGIMTRHEEAYTLRDARTSSWVGRVRVKNTTIMKLTTISAIHYIGCTKQDCGPYDLLWPRIQVTRAASGKTLPCPPPGSEGPSPGDRHRSRPTKQYFYISAGDNSESGCGRLPRWVSRLKDLAPPARPAAAASSNAPTLDLVNQSRNSSEKGMAVPTACGTGESPLYFVAQLSSSGSMSQLQSDGFSVVGLNPATGGAPSVVMVNPRKTDGSQVTADGLTAEAGVESAGAVDPQSSNPNLLSCDDRLSDQPADAPLVTAAIKALAAANLATPAQMNSEDASYLVGDDPLDPADNVVTIDTVGPGYRPGPGAPSVHQQIPHIAVLDRTTLEVSEVGVLPGGTW